MAAAATAVALAVNAALPSVSALTVAVVLGVLAGPLLPPATHEGVTFAAKTLLRIGVVLLGLRLSVADVVDLGAGTLLAVTVTVTASFAAILLLGRLLGLPRGLGLLVATGTSICGASAIAAMDSVSDTENEDVAGAVALVTVYGSAAMVAVPLLGSWWGWSPERIATWAGLSVHEVAQVVVAASPVGAAAVAVAVVVKLTRVVFLAPMVAGVSVWQRRRTPRDGGTRRPPLIPMFVLGFLLMMAARGTGLVPEGVLGAAEVATTVLFSAALFGLGTAVRPGVLLRGGWRGIAFGGLATTVVAGVAAAVLPLTGT
ncbi:putative membrane protein [Saccharomonospora xinjiangensis XJ-54]|uniref:Putative membrane protein n=1 Tax=Saccharomonospora xinjiangensis XJ-54 TaxID=882086 RepID=I0UXX8_9PSEU|nr:putative membrane protein [Saccharomonospora xinjiangensis XJ-54]